MINDDPHTLESMIDFIKLYLILQTIKLLEKDGILVIEDVQDIYWINTLKEVTPFGVKPVY